MTIARSTTGTALPLAVSIVVAGCANSTASSPAPQRPTAPQVAAAEPTHLDLPAESDDPGLQSKVTRVTVYSDRAQVTRQATAAASPEPTVLAFRRLPGWVDDGSVRVSASAGRIVDVRVERNFLARATDKSWQKAEADHQVLTNRLEALTDEIAVLDAQKAQIESIKAFSLAKITQDTTIGNVTVTTYSDVLKFISDSLRSTAQARRAVELKRKQIAPEFRASQRRLEEMQSLMKLEETTVLVTLVSPSPATSTLELTYMMPGATWEPMHELRVSTTDAKNVEVISYAAVTQTSGEDWGNAELWFSTQSSVQSVRIPELEALTLGDTQTATRTRTTKLSSFTRAQQAYASQNALWNQVHQKSSEGERVNFEQVYKTNMEYLQVVQGKTVSLFESLQKRGTTAHFKANAAPSVRGDGRPVRMRIGRSALLSTQKIVAVPEQSLNAARTLEMTNTTSQSFLPGKVALYQDGAFLGMTDIDFIAQGESFSLFVSVADHIKLSRKLDRKQSALIRRRRNQMQVAFIVTVENLSSAQTSLTLADRIPVSENKDIRIDRVRITPANAPDSRGLLHWELTLKPKEVRQFRISYQVEYPPELVLKTRHKRMNAPSPSAASPARTYEIEDQLTDLEEQF